MEADFLIQVTMADFLYRKQAMTWFSIIIMQSLKKEITVYGLQRIVTGTWVIATV